MKKLLIFSIVCFLVIPRAWSLEIKDRTFEIGLGAGAGFANNFLSAKDVFQDTFVLDIDKLSSGFKMNFNVDASPLYFNFNKNNDWGFGLAFNFDAVGIIGLSGKMLSFDEVINDKSEISAAVFAGVSAPGFFHVNKIKIKVSPAVYYPVVYASSDISYTFFTDDKGTDFNIGYGMNVHTAFPMEDSAAFKLTATPGIDISISAEYPLSEALGLNRKISFLDFDVGAGLFNIPLVSSRMRDYMKMAGKMGTDKPIRFGDGDADLSDIFSVDDEADWEYGEDKIKVYRPFKTLAWADWRPLWGQLLTITPSFGFAVNPLYLKPFSMEAGIKARLNVLNIFIADAGIGYHDRFWKNSIDLALNLRVFELNIGADLRATSFAKSWTGSGFGANVGLKFGF